MIFLPNPHIDLLTSPSSDSELTDNAPTMDSNIIAETPKSFRRFERPERDLKKY